MSGRPTLLTPQLQALICQELYAGSYLDDAAWLAGITDVTVRNWMDAGRANKSPEHVEFLAAVKEAEARCKRDCIAKVREGGPGWQASMTFMERRWREQFGRTTQLVDDKGQDVARSIADIIEANRKSRGRKSA